MLKGKVAIITGGSSGIGLGIAKRFIQEGASVTIMARNSVRLSQAATEIKTSTTQLKRDVPLMTFSGDVSKVSDIQNFIITAVEAFGKIDIVVANAAVLVEASIYETTEDDFDTVINTNLKGTFFTINKALPHMKPNSSIILISSIAGNPNNGMVNSSIYAASKAAIRQLAASLTAELVNPKQIRTNVIEPGFIDTPIFDRFLKLDPKFKVKRGYDIPKGKLGTCEQVADLAAFLASDKSDYICGETIRIDGGIGAIYNRTNSGVKANHTFMFYQPVRSTDKEKKEKSHCTAKYRLKAAL